MVVLYILFGTILISSLLFKCVKKSSSNLRRKPPGSSAKSCKSLQLIKSRSGSNPPKNKKRDVQSIPSRSSVPPSSATQPDVIEKSRENIKPLPPKPFKNIKADDRRSTPKTPDEDYGEIPEPTQSAKRRREKKLEDEKKENIEKGFYQPKSDEDDTLEPIQSLKEERTDDTTKKSMKKKSPLE